MAGGRKAGKGDAGSAKDMGRKGPILWPAGGAVTRAWLRDLSAVLDFASRSLSPEELPTAVPADTADGIMLAAHRVLHSEPNIVALLKGQGNAQSESQAPVMEPAQGQGQGQEKGKRKGKGRGKGREDGEGAGEGTGQEKGRRAGVSEAEGEKEGQSTAVGEGQCQTAEHGVWSTKGVQDTLEDGSSLPPSKSPPQSGVVEKNSPLMLGEVAGGAAETETAAAAAAENASASTEAAETAGGAVQAEQPAHLSAGLPSSGALCASDAFVQGVSVAPGMSAEGEKGAEIPEAVARGGGGGGEIGREEEEEEEGSFGVEGEGADAEEWSQREAPERSAKEQIEVVVVGDVHGQLHDVIKLLRLTGEPGLQRMLVFNGDYVDRGAWGVETYLLLLALKVFSPDRVVLLRGNHESKFCVSNYGFERELWAKYGPRDAKHLFRRFLACFESHPIAALIADATFVCHGGLFRRDPAGHGQGQGQGQGQGKARDKDKGKGKGKSKGRANGQQRSKGGGDLELGTLSDLAAARRTILDPSGRTLDCVLSDCLWSDPCLKPGLSNNNKRGIGLLFGRDTTQEFLATNKLKLIIRSHEGPDAREKRPEMQSMRSGFTVDHDVSAGRLVTLFSAPDYPQFQAGKFRHKNRAAFIRLTGPTWAEPKVEFFDAALPRPKATAFYDFAGGFDSDSDLELHGSDDESSEAGSEGSN